MEVQDETRAGSLRAGGGNDLVEGRHVTNAARPEDEAAAASLLVEAGRESWNVIATGHGRHLAVGEIPPAVDLLLHTDGLAGVREHEAADMTVTVGAGTTLTDLQAKLAQAGQWLPLDPPAATETTVGGLIAVNLAGPLRASQGTIRDFLIGIRTLDGRGEAVTGGGKVVKNVAGYDLPRLHVGALGTLGLILEATFKVRPLPAYEEAWHMSFDEPHSAVAKALALRETAEPGWLELVGSNGSRGGTWELFAGVLGEKSDVARTLEKWSSCGTPAGDRVSLAREKRQQLADAIAARPEIVLKAAVLPTDLGELLAGFDSVAKTHDFPVRTAAHIANGIARATVDAADHALALLASLRSRIEAKGGSFIVERAEPEDKRCLVAATSLKGTEPSGVELMRRVKAAMDPGDVLARGRMGWGI